MADEQNTQVEESTQKPEVEQTEQSQEGTQDAHVEAKGETQEEQTQEGQTQEPAEAESEEDPTIVRATVKGEEVVYDVKKKEDRERLRADAQKGIDYTKKSQALAEAERQHQSELGLAREMMNNPIIQKMMVAQRLGIDPSIVTARPIPVDESLREINPAVYWQQYYANDYVGKSQKLIEDTLGTVFTQTAQTNNTAFLNRVQADNDLSDMETQQVSQFMTENMRPSQIGMYSKQQFDAAVKIVQSNRLPGERLKIADNINQKLTRAMKATPKKTSVKEAPPQEDSSQSDFLKYVEDSSQ